MPRGISDALLALSVLSPDVGDKSIEMLENRQRERRDDARHAAAIAREDQLRRDRIAREDQLLGDSNARADQLRRDSNAREDQQRADQRKDKVKAAAITAWRKGSLSADDLKKVLGTEGAWGSFGSSLEQKAPVNKPTEVVKQGEFERLLAFKANLRKELASATNADTKKGIAERLKWIERRLSYLTTRTGRTKSDLDVLPGVPSFEVPKSMKEDLTEAIHGADGMLSELTKLRDLIEGNPEAVGLVGEGLEAVAGVVGQVGDATGLWGSENINKLVGADQISKIRSQATVLEGQLLPFVLNEDNRFTDKERQIVRDAFGVLKRATNASQSMEKIDEISRIVSEGRVRNQFVMELGVPAIGITQDDINFIKAKGISFDDIRTTMSANGVSFRELMDELKKPDDPAEN